MGTKIKLGSALGAAALLVSAACTQDLNVTNPNNPDVARVLASPTDVQSLAVSSVNSWYLGATYYDPWMMLSVTADALTGNFGNFGMRFNNLEPRIDYHNVASDNDAEVARDPWNNLYTALGQANSVLKAVNGGMKLPGGTDQYKALAQLTQAGSLMQLALIYDKAFIVDENFDASKGTPAFSPYTDVSKAAVAKFDALIAATSTAAGQAWTYSDANTIMPLSNGVTISGKTLNRLANTMAAMTLAYTPRTKADAAKVDWAKVLQYADKGIGTGSAGAPFDFTINGDGNNWYSYFVLYADDPTWARVDQRVINWMDPVVPAKFNGTQVAPSGTGDARLGKDGTADFNYEGTVIGQASRGIYMQSPYSFVRYINHSWQSDQPGVGPAPYILAAESDLLKAEALVRTNGDLALAATLINKTRVGRGKLAPLTASSGAAALLSAITYERVVELMETNGFTHFYLRHDDLLQPGTAKHLPVPASELETINQPIYTFGGVGLPDANFVPSTGATISANLLGTNGRTLALPNGSSMTLPSVGRHSVPRPTPFKQ
jgi:hypothetical protein